MRRWLLALAVVVAVSVSWAEPASAQAPASSQDVNQYYYYPYYYFPHNYWPSQGPKWPEHPRSPYMAPPAYMAYPPFLEPKWRYELWTPMRYYRGSHFWLDQF